METIENRLDYILAVACKMFKLAPFHNLPREEALVLGLVHETENNFDKNKKEQSKITGIKLGQSNYKYWREVYYMLESRPSFSSNMLDLLNYAVLTTNDKGDSVSLKEGIENWCSRCKNDLDIKDLRWIEEDLLSKGYI